MACVYRKVRKYLPAWFYWADRKLRVDEFCDSYVLISYLFRPIAPDNDKFNNLFWKKQKQVWNNWDE